MASSTVIGPWQMIRAGLIVLLVSSQLVSAILLDFKNCLDQSIQSGTALQFVPLFFDASYDSVSVEHGLNITVYGNVTGSRTGLPLPPSSDPVWANPNVTMGKIPDTDPSWQSAGGELLATTLFARTDVLTYTPWSQNYRFCNQTVHGTTCPLGPIFQRDTMDASKLNAFAVSHNFFSSYAFTTFATTLRITSGSVDKASLGCISANITPDLGSSITAALTFVPVVILILVGLATAFAANFSPWGTSNFYRWTANYGRDEDLLRLVTPGFGDCLQYIQFVVLTGSLSLSYPGYYQPVVAQAAWSILMFPSNFVSKAPLFRIIADGVYALRIDSRDGLDRMSQYAGIARVEDIWASMVVWLLVILAIVLAVFSMGSLILWLLRRFGGLIEQDRRRKGIPFSVGMVIRIIFGYLLLPIIALSSYQFVVSAHAAAPVYLVVLASILIILTLAFTLWLALFIGSTGSAHSTKSRAHLFDDFPTVLRLGPLYNTYRDDAALFTIVPLAMAILRGVAIGAIQPSGIAQLVLLAVSELLYMLILHAVRPYKAATSMNAYQTFFSAVRVLTLFLLIAFAPSLGVAEAPKGWIGFVILLMHAAVLVFGFFMNAIQTIVEVGARMAGAGGDEGAQRGGLVKVLGNRQLRRREVRRDSAHLSVGSRTTQLMSDHKMENNRPRSASGSSALLLATTPRSGGRLSQYETGSQAASDSLQQGWTVTSSQQSPAETPSEPNGNFSFSDHRHSRTTSMGSAQLLNTTSAELQPKPIIDPYYRPPRARRTTQDISPGQKSRSSWTSGDWANHRWTQAMADNNGDMASAQSRGPPVLMLGTEGHSDINLSRQRTDYATREVDYYYGVRGPALSEGQTRKMHTGPADPTGPLASATGWVRNLLAGRKREKGKGFEVVRSTRAPPPRFSGGNSPPDEEAAQTKELEALGVNTNDPYSDAPQFELPAGRPHDPMVPTPDSAPSLPDIVTGDDLDIATRHQSIGRGPTQLHSISLTHPPSSFKPTTLDPPAIPRKSSKRNSMSSSKDRSGGILLGQSQPQSEPPHLTIGVADDSDNESNRSQQHGKQPSTSTANGGSRLAFHSERSSMRSSVGESLLLGPLSFTPASPKFHHPNPYHHGYSPSIETADDDGSDIGIARSIGRAYFGSPGEDVGGLRPNSLDVPGGSPSLALRSRGMVSGLDANVAEGDEPEEGRPMSVGRVQGDNVVRIVTPDPGSRESLALQHQGSRALVEGGPEGAGKGLGVGVDGRQHGRSKSSLSSTLFAPDHR